MPGGSGEINIRNHVASARVPRASVKGGVKDDHAATTSIFEISPDAPIGFRHDLRIASGVRWLALFLFLCIPAAAQVRIEVFKAEKILLVYTREGGVLPFNVCRMSGGPGPKRRSGDRQVPEGVYRVIRRIGPALLLDYPNGEDRRLGRTGGGIEIHGGCASIGCISLTDVAMQDLLVCLRRETREWEDEIEVTIRRDAKGLKRPLLVRR